MPKTLPKLTLSNALRVAIQGALTNAQSIHDYR